MVTLRNARPDDLDILYEICAVTGLAGQDASHLHNDRNLIGHIYVAPYVVLEPAQALVAEDERGVAGYLVGTQDTIGFADKLNRDWWPDLRQRYATLTFEPTEADLQRISAINQPESSPADIVAEFPAHIHMNLLPRLRGQGVGSALVKRWITAAREAGIPGIHLGASTSNTGGVAFWTKVGFEPLRQVGRTSWHGMKL